MNDKIRGKSATRVLRTCILKCVSSNVSNRNVLQHTDVGRVYFEVVRNYPLVRTLASEHKSMCSSLVSRKAIRLACQQL